MHSLRDSLRKIWSKRKTRDFQLRLCLWRNQRKQSKQFLTCWNTSFIIYVNPLIHCRLDSRYFWQQLLKGEWFYKIFEGELLVMFWATFLLQIFCQLCSNLRDFIKIVRLVWASVSIYGLKYHIYNLILYQIGLIIEENESKYGKIIIGQEQLQSCFCENLPKSL